MPTTVVIVVDQVALPDFCLDLSAVAVEVKRALLFSSRANEFSTIMNGSKP